MFDIDSFKKEYPEFASVLTLDDTIRLILIFVIPFLIAYFYIIFVEDRIPEVFKQIKNFYSKYCVKNK